MMGRLLILTFVVYSCTAAPTTDRVVPENLDFTAFSKLAPTDLLQAVIQSGGTEADCRTFATTTISTISESVKSQGETLNAVDDGAGCASKGQDLVQVAQGKLQGKQGVLASKQGSAKAAREAKTAACTAAVDMSVGLDTLTKSVCYDYATEASFISAAAACTGATAASNQAAAAVVSAQTSVEDAQGEVDDAVAEAARLKSGCLCRVHQEQAAAQVAVQAATATNAADWKQAHEVLCAIKKTTTCHVPSCPTVTQPTLADGVANADTQHCTQAPTDAPTESPTEAPTPNNGVTVGSCDVTAESGWTYVFQLVDDRSKQDMPAVSERSSAFSNDNAGFIGNGALDALDLSKATVEMCAGHTDHTQGQCTIECTPLVDADCMAGNVNECIKCLVGQHCPGIFWDAQTSGFGAGSRNLAREDMAIKWAVPSHASYGDTIREYGSGWHTWGYGLTMHRETNQEFGAYGCITSNTCTNESPGQTYSGQTDENVLQIRYRL